MQSPQTFLIWWSFCGRMTKHVLIRSSTEWPCNNTNISRSVVILIRTRMFRATWGWSMYCAQGGMVLQQCKRNYQSLKGAVAVTLCQNEADVKCQMDIDSQISLTEQARKIRQMQNFKWTLTTTALLLPHSSRGSRQLLLSIPDRSGIFNDFLV